MQRNKKLCVYFAIFALVVFAGFAVADDAAKLIEKVAYDDMAGLKELLANGADINAQDEQSGNTALIMSCNWAYADYVKFLLSNGADVNLQAKNGTTALMTAAQRSQELVELLIKHGADASAKLPDSTTAFTKSIIGALSESVTLEVPALFLAKGANVDEAPATGDAQGYTCLMMAARNGSASLVQFLLKNGADINAKAKDGSTALSLATKSKLPDMIKLLKEKGAKE